MRTFLFGVLLGALAGVLYAPATGNRTRSLLRDKATRYRNNTACFLDAKSRDLSNRLEGARHKADAALSEIKEQARERADKMQDAVQDTMSQAQEKLDQAQEKIGQVKGMAQEKMHQVRDSIQEAMKEAERQEQNRRSA